MEGVRGGLPRYVMKKLTIWSGYKFPIVMYELSFIMVFVSTAFLYLHRLANDMTFFRNVLDVRYIKSIILLNISHIRHGGDAIENVGLEMDLWWNYNYLQDLFNIKLHAEQQFKTLAGNIHNFIAALADWHAIVPFLRYIFSGMSKTTKNLMLKSRFLKITWLYFEIVAGGKALHRGIPVIFYDLIMEVIQIRLSRIAIIALEKRLLRTIRGNDVFCCCFDIRDKLVSNEVKSCARHYHTIYRQIQMVNHVIEVSLSQFYYTGCLCFDGLEVLLMKVLNSGYYYVTYITSITKLTQG